VLVHSLFCVSCGRIRASSSVSAGIAESAAGCGFLAPQRDGARCLACDKSEFAIASVLKSRPRLHGGAKTAELSLRNLRKIPSWIAARLTAIAVEQSEIRTLGFLENRTPAKLARRRRAGKHRSSSRRDHRFRMASFLHLSFQTKTKLRATRKTHDREDAALPDQCTAFGCRTATQAGRMPTRSARTSIH
jgi:hypothetical protein